MSPCRDPDAHGFMGGRLAIRRSKCLGHCMASTGFSCSYKFRYNAGYDYWVARRLSREHLFSDGLRGQLLTRQCLQSPKYLLVSSVHYGITLQVIQDVLSSSRNQWRNALKQQCLVSSCVRYWSNSKCILVDRILTLGIRPPILRRSIPQFMPFLRHYCPRFSCSGAGYGTVLVFLPPIG